MRPSLGLEHSKCESHSVLRWRRLTEGHTACTRDQPGVLPSRYVVSSLTGLELRGAQNWWHQSLDSAKPSAYSHCTGSLKLVIEA